MSYNVNVSKEVTMEIFDFIPKASAQREATENYEKVLRKDAMNLTKKVRCQIENASRTGKFSTVVEIKPNEISAWPLVDLMYYMKSVLMDLGYKVRFLNDDLFKLIIEW